MKIMDNAIEKDLFGYPFNAKYPPCPEKYGNRYHGYATDARETLFYNFAVQGYDLRFRYHGKWYYFMSEADHVARCDEAFWNEYERFPSANAMIEQFEIDGKKLLDIIDELEDVEAM